MKYVVRGRFRVDKEWRKFTKEIEAPNKRVAVEWTYSIMGSKHKVKRNLIEIEEVLEAE
ncbi:MAG: large subunit ribosomal protein [Archaeoglobi archaeon]|nr:large subunit ribosomal protein [Archaeoglobi archaeon]